MIYKAGVITISTKGAKGERVDTSGPNLVNVLKNEGFDVVYENIITDDIDIIKNELIKVCDDGINLILTTGGTGFSKTDVTPEATLAIIEKEVRGIPEMMRNLTYKITDKSILSRGVAGIRNKTLIINLPGSKKASEENFNAIKEPIKHGIEILLTDGSNDCAN